MSLTQLDYTDREMVSLLHDCIVEGEFASILDMASKLGAPEDDTHIRRGIAVRLSYMARTLKLVQRHKTESGLWKLTKAGEALRQGALPNQLESLIADMSDGERVAVTMAVTQRGIIKGSASSALMHRRVVNYGMAHRRNGRRR